MDFWYARRNTQCTQAACQVIAQGCTWLWSYTLCSCATDTRLGGRQHFEKLLRRDESLPDPVQRAGPVRPRGPGTMLLRRGMAVGEPQGSFEIFQSDWIIKIVQKRMKKRNLPFRQENLPFRIGRAEVARVYKNK